jgi:hypothetical protein
LVVVMRVMSTQGEGRQRRGKREGNRRARSGVERENVPGRRFRGTKQRRHLGVRTTVRLREVKGVRSDGEKTRNICERWSRYVKGKKW